LATSKRNAKNAEPLKKGDAVSWNSSQGRVDGVVERKLTRRTKIKGHDVAASEANPEVLVRSSATEAVAAHKPSALKQRSRAK
jgi:hypothetical protein